MSKITTFFQVTFTAWRYLPVMLALFFIGCNTSQDWRTETHPARGKVTVNGESPVNLFVILNPLETPFDSRNSKPWGIVDANGDYRVMTYESNDGAPIGTYAITMRWPFDPSKSTDRLQGVYNTIENSPLTITITQGENILPPIELKNVKVAKASSNTNSPSTQLHADLIPSSSADGQVP
ncbi:hypothetical protein M4951_20035 [Blastopirellula sp. J2-11]|uniref:hypothetical protein n=1 Tax=Blastopirellula sp. J2-11 TaxID=2943192 RepID=UPI0021CA5EC9|nr:hypothetical protein [Blastopirellula sp. J2-11]UUO05652.1 hypothetical protein M4951_20035 [Blastopirellula sp. J2-11]